MGRRQNGKRKQREKHMWISDAGPKVILEACLSENYQSLDLSKKLGPETEKVFQHFRKAGISVGFAGKQLDNNNTSIDRLAPVLKCKETFLEMVAWKTIDIARSRWSINEDGKASCSNNTIVITDLNVAEIVQFCRTGGPPLIAAKSLAKATVNGRWLTMSSLQMSVKWLFKMVLEFELTDEFKNDENKQIEKWCLKDVEKVAIEAHEKEIDKQLMAKILEELYCIVNLSLPKDVSLSSMQSSLPCKWRGVSVKRHPDIRIEDRIRIANSFIVGVYRRLLFELNHRELSHSLNNVETFNTFVIKCAQRISQRQDVVAEDLLQAVEKSWQLLEGFSYDATGDCRL
jgi:hypothetical protein